MRKESQIFTSLQKQDKPISAELLDTLESQESMMGESLIRSLVIFKHRHDLVLSM